MHCQKRQRTSNRLPGWQRMVPCMRPVEISRPMMFVSFPPEDSRTSQRPPNDRQLFHGAAYAMEIVPQRQGLGPSPLPMDLDGLSADLASARTERRRCLFVPVMRRLVVLKNARVTRVVSGPALCVENLYSWTCRNFCPPRAARAQPDEVVVRLPCISSRSCHRCFV